MQKSNVTELAKLLKGMENPKTLGISIGKVTKIPPDDPLTITIADGLIALTDGEELTQTETVKNATLQKDDEVLVVPTTGEQKWIAVDKISED